MIQAVKTGVRGLIIYGTIGLAVGSLVAFGFAPCGAGQWPPFWEQVSVAVQFAGAFSAVGFLMGFFSAWLFGQTKDRHG